jgi:hypothetical protein
MFADLCRTVGGTKPTGGTSPGRGRGSSAPWVWTSA